MSQPVTGCSISRSVSSESNGSIIPTGRLVVHKLPKVVDRSASIEIATDEIAVSDQSTHGRETVGEAIRVADNPEQSSVTDCLDDGSITLAMGGKGHVGETDTLNVCQLLVSRLNRHGALWEQPSMPDRVQGIDCEACFSGTDSGKDLKIQVTSAECDPRLWEMLNTTEASAHEYPSPDVVADTLGLSVGRKAAKIADAQRAELVLALNATKTASHVLKAVIDSFRLRHGSWAQGWVSRRYGLSDRPKT